MFLTRFGNFSESIITIIISECIPLFFSNILIILCQIIESLVFEMYMKMY